MPKLKKELLEQLVRISVQEIFSANDELEDYNEEPAGYADIADAIANDEELLYQLGREGLTVRDMDTDSWKFFRFMVKHLDYIKKKRGFLYVKSPQDLEVDWHYANRESNMTEVNDTIGAPAPPADGLGTADQPPLPRNADVGLSESAQFKHLVRHVVKETLDELMSSQQASQQNPNTTSATLPLDPAQDSVGLLNPAQKAKADHEAEKLRRETLKQREADLKSTKAKLDFNKREQDQQKRFAIPTLTKQIQGLKGGVGAMGT